MAASSTSAAPEVDRSRRFDLLPLYARGNPAMSTLATEVTKAVERRAAAEGRLPCLFSHERHLAESRKAVFQAIMQTRGGGVVLALLSPDFFQDCWCIAALLAALEVHGKAVSSEKLKLRFVCIEDELDAVREDELRKRLFPQLFEQSEVVGIARSANPVVMALCGADRVWDAWNGSATGTRPTALGGTVRHSFSGLSRALPPAAVPHLNFLSGDPRPESVADALEAALFKEVINLYLVDLLEEIAIRSFASQLQRDMLTAHADRWIGDQAWDWSMTTLNSLEQMQTTAHELMNAVQAVREPAADPRAAQPTRFTSAGAMGAARSGGVDAAAFNVPQEADQFIVKTALSHGASKLCSVRVLLLGGSERGKTSTVESLLGHAFVENRPSTRGIDLKTHCLAPGLRGLSAEKVRERSSTVDSFAAAVSRIVLQQTSQARPSSGSHHASGAPLDRSNATSRASIPRNAHPTQASDVHHRVLNAAARALRAPVEIRGDNGQLLRIWDFGGQKEYEACHQLFMSQRSVLMLAIDLQKFWCEGTRDDEFAELKSWLRCAFSLTERPASQHVVVVGTRKNTCGDVEGAWEALEDLICKWSSTVYNTWVRAPATGGAAMMKKIALENDGAIFDADGSGLRELEDHLWSITGQIIENSEPVPVKWRALLEELVRVGQNELFLTKEKVMEVASGFPGFPESTDSLDVTVMEMLRYCRDLGELILFEMSSDLDCSLPVKGDTCVVFVDPEKLLKVLRALIGPCKDVVLCLQARHRAELREKGLVDMEALDVLWRDVPKSYRFTMLIMLCRFDLLVRLEWHERGRRMVGIPALMPQLGSDADSFVERMGRRHDERDLEVYTIFTELFPVGLIGVLIASLHNTVGRQRTPVYDFRADGVLLKLNKWGRVFVKYVTHGQDSMGAHIKWLFRGKAPVGIAHRCLQQFYVLMQCQFRKVDIASYRHVIISDCALDLSCCPSNVADCDGHGCGAKGSVELKIDSERLWDDVDSSELRVRFIKFV